MDLNWMFLDIRNERQRDQFFAFRHQLYKLVYSGQISLDEYWSFVVGLPERWGCFQSLAQRKLESSKAENYCYMAYAVASHLIALGNAETACDICSDLLDFLDDVKDNPEDFPGTGILSEEGSSDLWEWKKLHYKALRISALAYQHVSIGKRRGNSVCLNPHNSCVSYIDRCSEGLIYDRGRHRFVPATEHEEFRRYELDALSDLIRCYFRLYVVNGFDLDRKTADNIFRQDAIRFRIACSEFEGKFGLMQLSPRWVDTWQKLAIICFDHLSQWGRYMKLLGGEESEKATDQFALVETRCCDDFVNNFSKSQADITEIVRRIDDAAAQAVHMHLLGAEGHLNRLRNAIC